MNRIWNIVPVAAALYLLTACGNTNVQTRNTTDTLNATSGKQFSDWIATLKVLEKPLELYGMPDITGKTGPFDSHPYKSVTAGVLSAGKHYYAVLFQCTTQHSATEVVTFLVTYTPDGRQIATREVGMEKDISESGSHTYVRKWPVMENDSIAEIREAWDVIEGEDEGDMETKARIKFIRIAWNGEIVSIPQETETFEAFAARFPSMKLPLTISKPDNALLKRISMFTPYFNFEEYIYYDSIKVYHYGKVASTAKQTILLYATDELGQEELEQLPSVLAVAYDAGGKETDRLLLQGGTATEGYSRGADGAVIDMDGTIHVKKTETDAGLDGLIPVPGETVQQQVCRLNAIGRFMQETKSIAYTFSSLDAASLKGEFDERRKYPEQVSWKDSICQLVFSIPWERSIYVALHAYDVAGEQLVELFTATQDGKPLDHYIVYSTLKKTPPAKAITIAGLEPVAETPQAENALLFNGVVTITFDHKTMHISKEGKFTE
ncbi:MAG TPA: hypothetical protein VM802_32105 [Chitinophaga sp.]|uniref:hypothetical protein n=1 Tax=Chitinophaga sp. TaxID=1869181 RepID=UPI002B611DD5|nr:hypothetical protein [Chitinophaga sp.]HVI49555.1 hypothetical protein [Chitinophaga sp.]